MNSDEHHSDQLKAYARDLVKSYRKSKALALQNKLIRENTQLRADIEQITRHDLKAPLSAIISYPQLIKRDGGLTEKQEAYIQRIEAAGRMMLEMINRSHDLYKMETGTYQLKPLSVDLLPLVQTGIRENREIVTRKHLKMKVLVNDHTADPNDTFTLKGEKLLFYTLMANLIKNAVEASPKGGEVTVSLYEKPPEKIMRIRNETAVPEKIRDRFFEKFVTSGKIHGTGLGTYSARLISQTLGGRITLESSADNETAISIAFAQPVAEKASNSIDDLICNKKATGRTQDLADAEALELLKGH